MSSVARAGYACRLRVSVTHVGYACRLRVSVTRVGYACRLHVSVTHVGYMEGMCQCQGVLTVGFRASGGVLELFEARICLERLAERPCALWTDLVVVEAANKGRIGVSEGADSRLQGGGQRTRRFAALY